MFNWTIYILKQPKEIYIQLNNEYNTLAAPVLLGIMLNEAALPPLQSLLDGPSTVFWVAKRIHETRKLDQNFWRIKLKTEPNKRTTHRS